MAARPPPLNSVSASNHGAELSNHIIIGTIGRLAGLWIEGRSSSQRARSNRAAPPKPKWGAWGAGPSIHRNAHVGGGVVQARRASRAPASIAQHEIARAAPLSSLCLFPPTGSRSDETRLLSTNTRLRCRSAGPLLPRDRPSSATYLVPDDDNAQRPPPRTTTIITFRRRRPCILFTYVGLF